MKMVVLMITRVCSCCAVFSCSVVSNSLWPMDCSPPGSSVHGILQTRELEWVDIPFSRGSSRPRDWTYDLCIAGRFFTIWATKPGGTQSSGGNAGLISGRWTKISHSVAQLSPGSATREAPGQSKKERKASRVKVKLSQEFLTRFYNKEMKVRSFQLTDNGSVPILFSPLSLPFLNLYLGGRKRFSPPPTPASSTSHV